MSVRVALADDQALVRAGLRALLKAQQVEVVFEADDGADLLAKLETQPVDVVLSDIRSVVQAMRDSRGLDLQTAIRALAAPLPRPALALHIEEGVKVDDHAVAESLLRIVQECLTNAARHAGAETLTVSLKNEEAGMHLRIEDDGRMKGGMREGNGVSGIRERVAALGGELQFGTSATGGLRLDVRLPA